MSWIDCINVYEVSQNPTNIEPHSLWSTQWYWRKWNLSTSTAATLL